LALKGTNYKYNVINSKNLFMKMFAVESKKGDDFINKPRIFDDEAAFTLV